MSNESLSMMAISLLACVDIMPGLDEAGNPKQLKLDLSPSVIAFVHLAVPVRPEFKADLGIAESPDLLRSSLTLAP